VVLLSRPNSELAYVVIFDAAHPVVRAFDDLSHVAGLYTLYLFLYISVGII
jgi:hypothetical protein